MLVWPSTCTVCVSFSWSSTRLMLLLPSMILPRLLGLYRAIFMHNSVYCFTRLSHHRGVCLFVCPSIHLSIRTRFFTVGAEVATESTSWDNQACTRNTLCCQRNVTTSKEYLINCHSLLQYFEMVLFSYNYYKFCVNWSSFEWITKKTKRGPFYETPCILLLSLSSLFLQP